MKLSSAAAPAEIATVSRRRRDAEFLPAALEIIESPPSPIGRAISLTIIAFVAAAIIWACFSQVDIIATAEGRIIPTGKSKIIQPFDMGVVRRIAVADGDKVRANDILVELDPTTDASDATRLAYDLAQDHLDVARLHALIAGDLGAFHPPAGVDVNAVQDAQRQMNAQAGEHLAKIEGVDHQIAEKTAEGREIATAIDKARATLPLLREQEAMRKALVDNQYGSRLQLLQVEQQVVETQHDLESQRHRQEENVQSLAALQKQREETDAEYAKGLAADLAKAQLSTSDHREEIRKAALKRDLRTLRAPVDGTVQQLTVHTLGGIVSPGEQLMVIVPEGSHLEIEASLENKDVGFVHQGQEAEVKVEAFTFTRYGLLHGQVTGISHDTTDGGESREGTTTRAPAKSSEADRRDDPQSAAYIAHVSLAAASIATEQGMRPLAPGMAVTTEIKTGRRTVMGFLLSPLQRLRQEGLRER